MGETNIALKGKRPVGITIIAILLCIEGIFALVAAFTGLVIISNTPLVLIGFTITVIIGLVSLLLTWGLWTLKSWAFGVTVAVQIFSIVFTLLNFVLMIPKGDLSTTIENLIFPVAILIYLFADKNVRPAFRN